MKRTLQAMLLALVAIMMPIGAWAQETTVEAKWGASAESLTHEGTLAEAIKAAVVDYDGGDYTASDVAYIQLQSSVTTTGDHVIYGGTFTLDLNGHTLTSDGYTLSIRNEGTDVTLTDSSEDGAGKVVSTGSGNEAVYLLWGAHVTIEGGSYESESTAVIIQSGCSATISGGTFLGGSEHRVVYNDGTLIISGGTFDGEGIWSSVCAASSSESTTITGGTFAVGSKGTFEYNGGRLDLTGYPTTETEGTTPLIEVSVDNDVANVTVDVTTIALPTGYCFYNSSEQAVTMLVAGDRYTIGEEPDTKYTITFAPDGGSGEMAAGVNYGNNSHILPECTFTAPEGMMFKAWLVGDTEYQPGEAITVTENTTVTAVWTDYVPQIILRLADSYGDGWNGAAITVKKDGEEIGVVTIENGRTATFRYDYDSASAYTFYWTEGQFDSECSFVIKVEGKTVLTASANDCNGYEDGQLIHTIGAVGGGEGSGETTVEAKWGASAASLTHEGTLAEAIRAAEESSDVAYIQLQSSGTTTGDHVIYGGTFTLDLNGHTLTSDGYTLDIRNEGTDVTLTDGSEDGAGKVVSTGSGCAAVYLLWGAHVTIEGGCYESASTAVFVESGCSATISGGTFLGSSSSTVYNNGSLIISGGTFGGEGIQSSVYAGNSSVNTTITGGTFAEASTGTIAYYGGKLDLTGYPTTETEGTTSLTEISVDNGSGSIAVDATTIALPTGYCFYNSSGQAVTMLEFHKKYTIGTEPDTKYTITYAPDGGSGEMAVGISYGYGGYSLPECTFTAPEGKMFKAWQVGDEEYQPGETITVTENTAVTAVWRDYVPQITLELTDDYGDGWNDAAITVKKDGEEIGVATIEDGRTATFRYDYASASAYTFYWTKGSYNDECSFVIKVEGETVFTAAQSDCNGYTDDQLIHTIGAVGGGGTTEIAPSTLNSSPSTIIYDLAGRRVEQPTKGVYLVNGKKVVIND